MNGFLPILTTQPQQEPTQKSENDAPSEQKDKQNNQDGQSQGQENQAQSGQSDGGSDQPQEEKPVFSARETALFLRGKRVSTLTAEETFAFSAVKNSLKLAPYTIEKESAACSLTIKQNDAKLSLQISNEGSASLKIKITLTAGILDYSKALPIEEVSDAGDVPDGVFAAAEKKLAADITSVFEKARLNGYDLFGIQELLIKHKARSLHRYKNTVLQNTRPSVHVSFRNLR